MHNHLTTASEWLRAHACNVSLTNILRFSDSVLNLYRSIVLPPHATAGMWSQAQHETCVQVVHIQGQLYWQHLEARERCFFGIAPVLFAGIAAIATEQARKGSVAIILLYRRHVEQMQVLLAQAMRETPQQGPLHDILVLTREACTGSTVDHTHFLAVHERDMTSEYPGGHITDASRRWIACTRGRLSLTVYVQQMTLALQPETANLQKLARDTGVQIRLHGGLKSLRAFTSLHGNTNHPPARTEAAYLQAAWHIWQHPFP